MTEIFDEVAAIERRLGLPTGFYQSLLAESDWAFVIKLHALFEAVATHTLVIKLGHDSLEESLSRIELSDSRYGKAKLLRDLGAITGEQAGFIRFLSEIRNKLVHRIENVGFLFEAHVADLDSNQRARFVQWAGLGVRDEIQLRDKTVAKRDFVLQNPKLSIWMTASEVVACLRLEEEFADLERQEAAFLEERAATADILLKSAARLMDRMTQAVQTPDRESS